MMTPHSGTYEDLSFSFFVDLLHVETTNIISIYNIYIGFVKFTEIRMDSDLPAVSGAKVRGVVGSRT